MSGSLTGISEMFGLRDDASNGGDASTRTSRDTVGRWVTATDGEPPQRADASGRLVHGRYRLIAELGQGGMGVTYRAWDTRAGIPVVVKMPRREVRQDQEVMARFAREIEAMKSVPHESIVPITDSGEDEGCAFVVMRFLPGGSLADYRRWDESGKPIKNPPGMLFYWLPGVASALDRIHDRRMLHRDVKPGNIFLDGFLKPFLGDFGIAKVVDEAGGLVKEATLTATKMAVGTPEYMAPELFKPRVQPDSRVDQYALAVTVYEMLCGEKPFTGGVAHIVVEHSSLPVPSLEKRCPGLPQSVYAAVHRALAKRPEERFTTCEDFAAAVLGDLEPLKPEADTVRLLCPSCRNILKLPQKSAGKKGRCPRCQSTLDVAADLGSLWLESEERGEKLVESSVATTKDDPPQKEIDSEFARASRRAWRTLCWTAAIAFQCAFLIAAIWGSVSRATLERQHQANADTLRSSLEQARIALERESQKLTAEREQSAEQMQQLNETQAALSEARIQLESDRKARERERPIMAAEIQQPAQAPQSAANKQAQVSRQAALTIESGEGFSMDFVTIPAGRFKMGSPRNEPGYSRWEQQVDVQITEGFEVGKYEVTQQQWISVMKSEPWKGYAQSVEGRDFPATCVGWQGAMEFCRLLTAAEQARGTLPKDKVYRLPTEAEWEYACRAGSTTVFSFGDDVTLFDRFGWADGKPPRAVGLKLPNAWGLCDMHGNVSEWCLDWNDMKPLAGGDDPLGPEPGHQHMQRGGHSRYEAGWMHRSGYRKDGGTSGSDTEGFRVVRGSPRPITPPAPAIKEAVPLPPRKPLEASETFTLSDEALLKLDFQPRSTARIINRRDSPGPGVEFEIEFKGNVDKDCSGQWVYRAKDPATSGSATLSTDLTPYRAFGLQFELLGVDGKRPASFKAPLLVGSLIAGYRPESIDTVDKPRAVSVTSFHESFNPLRELGFVVNIPGWWYEKDPSKNPWPEKGCVIRLRLSPAPGAVALPLAKGAGATTTK